MSANNLNFDEGIKEYTINNDPNRVLRVNTRDINILTRVSDALKEMESKINSMKEEDFRTDENATDVEKLDVMAKIVETMNNYCRNAFDKIFYPGASEIVFGQSSPMSTVNGVTLFEGFLNAFVKEIKPILEEEKKKREKHVMTYQKKYEELHAIRQGK